MLSRRSTARWPAGVARRCLTSALLLPAALTGALGACTRSPQQVADGDDALAALTSSVASTRYNQGFWREQAHTDSAGKWAKALAYCGHLGRPRPGLEADGAKPNCGAVNGAEWDLNNERAMREVNARVEAARRRDERMQRDPAYRKYIMDSVEKQYGFGAFK